ncbi:MAG: RluA family pseudouridine synthase [Deferribacteres bacterium]|nr:RluA family pseudouridine synthase [Deferribacteres bacterium]
MQKAGYTVRLAEAEAERLDVFIASETGLTRSYVQKLVRQGLVTVNSHACKPGCRVREGDRIEMTIPDEPEAVLIPEDIPLDVIWEDEHIIAVNKAPGMVIYPAAGHRSGTLMNALIARCGRLASTGAPLRPGVVHRLDKDTSGLIVVAKNDAAYTGLNRQFRAREVEKHYLALIFGRLKKERGEIVAAIGRSASDRKRMSTKAKNGKEAITRFEVVKRLKSATLARVRIITGRTHQIRVHFTSIGHPVLGDRTYGRKTCMKAGQKTINFSRQMLHACFLRFTHPVTGDVLELSAPMPEDMEKAIRELEG